MDKIKLEIPIAGVPEEVEIEDEKVARLFEEEEEEEEEEKRAQDFKKKIEDNF